MVDPPSFFEAKVLETGEPLLPAPDDLRRIVRRGAVDDDDFKIRRSMDNNALERGTDEFPEVIRRDANGKRWNQIVTFSLKNVAIE